MVDDFKEKGAVGALKVCTVSGLWVEEVFFFFFWFSRASGRFIWGVGDRIGSRGFRFRAFGVLSFGVWFRSLSLSEGGGGVLPGL